MRFYRILVAVLFDIKELELYIYTVMEIEQACTNFQDPIYR